MEARSFSRTVIVLISTSESRQAKLSIATEKVVISDTVWNYVRSPKLTEYHLTTPKLLVSSVVTE